MSGNKSIWWSWLFCLVLLGLSENELFSQSDLLVDFNKHRLYHQKTAMYVLGSWAVGNIITGSILQGRYTGSDRYFHQMNIYWNLVNAGIAAFGFYSIKGQDPDALTLTESMTQYLGFQKALLFNAGLDVGYIAAGFCMVERAKRPGLRNADRLSGFGRSVILQGGFLFVFDLVAYFTSLKPGKNLFPFLQLGHGNGIELGLGFNF